MVVMYEIAGRKVGSHVLSMMTLGSAFAIGAYFSSGSKKAVTNNTTPPINAGSKDEENFIQQFMQEADGGKQKQSSANPIQ